jgi:Leucine-rich repeat (LRR) protein
LEELDLSLCWSLKEIPEGFGGLTSLKKFDMWECEALEAFPLGVSKLSGLEELDFSKCPSLKEIPEGFGGLTSLKKLHVWEY